jgi:DNA-nicking Smr family endonuclease
MNEDDDLDFARLVGPVRRLEHDRIEPDRPRRSARVRAGGRPSDHPLREVAEPPAEAPAQWFHHGLQKKRIQRIRQGELPLDARLDLHGLRRDQAVAELSRFLHHALLDGCRFLVIVHGQGYGSENEAVLKPLTRHWLSQQQEVLAWCPARPRHGGGGATYVYLRRPTS